MGMFDTDKVYGGKRLDEWCQESGGLPMVAVLWNCGIVAENVETKVGAADKAELVLTPVALDPAATKGKSSTPPAVKVGTFASAITEKVKQKADGDLPAVVRFETAHSEQWDSEAFVMSFVAPAGDVEAPDNLSSRELNIAAIDMASVPFD